MDNSLCQGMTQLSELLKASQKSRSLKMKNANPKGIRVFIELIIREYSTPMESKGERIIEL